MQGRHVIAELTATLGHKMTHATPERDVCQVCPQVYLEDVTGQEVFFTNLEVKQESEPKLTAEFSTSL